MNRLQRSPWSVRVALIALTLLLLLGLGVKLWNRREPPPSPREHVPSTWEEARLTPMHTAHGAKGVACESCHVEGFTTPPRASTCPSCHGDQASISHHENVAAVSCLSCHSFTPSHPAATCASCHTQASTVQKPLEHHTSPQSTCTTCHALHRNEPAARVTCLGCHRAVEASHGSWHVAPTMGAGATTNNVAECSNCHAPHSGREAARATCAGCHVGAAPSAAPQIAPRGPGVAGHPACVSCHEGHAARIDAVRACDSCHAERRGAAKIAGHRSCIGCHAPHATGEASQSCAGCHTQRALGASHVDEHASCTSCHDVHGGRDGLLIAAATTNPAGACASCHANVKPTHPTAKNGAFCTGCHLPHPATPTSIVQPCSACHDTSRSRLGGAEHAFHHAKTACVDCHTSHQFDLSGRGPALCARCHAREASQIRTGHAACASCHATAHAPVASPSCASCHAAETKSAPAGHARCVQCHDAHSGTSAPQTTCTGCHAAESKTPHGAIATGCATCHRPHGPNGKAQPPACASCHAPRSLPGLHGVTAHAARCSSCHDGHTAPQAARATCTSTCHVERRTHQPEASSCQGCHLFRR